MVLGLNSTDSHWGVRSDKIPMVKCHQYAGMLIYIFIQSTQLSIKWLRYLAEIYINLMIAILSLYQKIVYGSGGHRKFQLQFADITRPLLIPQSWVTWFKQS